MQISQWTRHSSSRKPRTPPQQPNFSVATQHTNLHTFLKKHRYDPSPQVSRQMPRVDLKWVGRCCLSIARLGHAHPLSRLGVHHLLRDSRQKLSLKRNIFLPNHLNIAFWRVLTWYHYFCYFSVVCNELF